MFHAQDGWCLTRLPDGSVRIEKDSFFTVVTPELWASIVSSMSREGETLDTWTAALQKQRP